MTIPKLLVPPFKARNKSELSLEVAVISFNGHVFADAFAITRQATVVCKSVEHRARATEY